MACNPLLKEAYDNIDKSRGDLLDEVTDDFDILDRVDTVIKDDNSIDPKSRFGRSDGIHQYRENREHPIKELYVDQKFGDNYVDKDIDYGKWYDKIEDYTRHDYEAVNKEARDNIPITDKSILNFLDEAEENFDGVVYRGSRAGPLQQAKISKLEVGHILTNKSPLSTSIDFDTGRAFSTYNYDNNKLPVMLTIKSKGHDIAHASTNFDEAEVLLKPGKYYRLVDKIETDAQIQMVLEEVPEELIELYSTNSKFKPVKGILSIGGLGVVGTYKKEEK